MMFSFFPFILETWFEFMTVLETMAVWNCEVF